MMPGTDIGIQIQKPRDVHAKNFTHPQAAQRLVVEFRFLKSHKHLYYSLIIHFQEFLPNCVQVNIPNPLSPASSHNSNLPDQLLRYMHRNLSIARSTHCATSSININKPRISWMLMSRRSGIMSITCNHTWTDMEYFQAVCLMIG